MAKKKVQDLIDKFNDKYPPGAQVLWRADSHVSTRHELVTVKTPAYDNYGVPVAFFEERRGFCSIDPAFVDYTR